MKHTQRNAYTEDEETEIAGTPHEDLDTTGIRNMRRKWAWHHRNTNQRVGDFIFSRWNRNRNRFQKQVFLNYGFHDFSLTYFYLVFKLPVFIFCLVLRKIHFVTNTITFNSPNKCSNLVYFVFSLFANIRNYA